MQQNSGLEEVKDGRGGRTAELKKRGRGWRRQTIFSFSARLPHSLHDRGITRGSEEEDGGGAGMVTQRGSAL